MNQLRHPGKKTSVCLEKANYDPVRTHCNCYWFYLPKCDIYKLLRRCHFFLMHPNGRRDVGFSLNLLFYLLPIFIVTLPFTHNPMYCHLCFVGQLVKVRANMDAFLYDVMLEHIHTEHIHNFMPIVMRTLQIFVNYRLLYESIPKGGLIHL